jgi:hypothetical protein
MYSCPGEIPKSLLMLMMVLHDDYIRYFEFGNTV